MLGEEGRLDPPDRALPGHRLGAVLAELEARGLVRLGPGAARGSRSPRCWFSRSSVRTPRRRPIWSRAWRSDATTAGRPAAARSGASTSSRSSPWSSVGAGFVIAAEPTQLRFPGLGHRPMVRGIGRQKRWQGPAPWSPSWRGRPGGRPRCTTGWSTSCPRRAARYAPLGIEGFARVLRVPGRGHGSGVAHRPSCRPSSTSGRSSCTTRIPACWEAAPPERWWEARLEAVDAALRRIMGDDHPAAPETARAAELATTAARSARDRGPSVGGRPPRAGRARRAAPRPVVGHHRAARAPG